MKTLQRVLAGCTGVSLLIADDISEIERIT
jgi:aspartate/glutamate racemase